MFCHLSYFADFVHQPGGVAAGVDLLGDVRNLVADHVLDGVFVHLVLLGQGDEVHPSVMRAALEDFQAARVLLDEQAERLKELAAKLLGA